MAILSEFFYIFDYSAMVKLKKGSYDKKKEDNVLGQGRLLYFDKFKKKKKKKIMVRIEIFLHMKKKKEERVAPYLLSSF